ncbi:TPA: 50S ribosomal protein L1 [Candidatus Micrarchaeota archaeon]|nr:50S ribosomal protein L1 [Candidatus Micrarchaeota archaeon]
MMDKKKIQEALAKVFEDKGKRKFKQSVELIVNFRGIDFSKTEHRLNLDVALPKGKGGKEPKVAVIAEEAMANQAKNAKADLIILSQEISAYGAPDKIKNLADNYVLLAQPNLMGLVAKSLGQYLGPRGKLPRPVVGNVTEMIERTRRSVKMASKGKYLPVAQALVGTEEMKPEDIGENIEAVYDAVKNKTGEHTIKSVYIKMTMGAPIRVE